MSMPAWFSKYPTGQPAKKEIAAAKALSSGLQFIKAPVNAVSQTHQNTSCHLT
jgi:hypothetical protein